MRSVNVFTHYFLFLISLFVLIGFACHWPSIKLGTPVPSFIPLPSPTIVEITLSPTLEMFHNPTAEIAPSNPSLSTSVVIPTWTPLPTLQPRRAEELIFDLIETNGGCRLPCWWGITPGVASWDETRQFIATFAKEIQVGRTREQGIRVVIPIKGSMKDGGIGFWLNDDNVIDKILAGPISTQVGFKLEKLLRDYGQPSEILVQASYSFPANDLPFILVLYYQKEHILAIYDLVAMRMNNDLIACPRDLGPQIILWSLSEEWTEERVQSEVLGSFPSTRLRPLDEVTDLRVIDFYQVFSEPNNESCIVTPVEAWK